jgi:hypothetical protein
LLSSIITQALSSNLTYDPSFLLTSFEVLTITAFTTFFFLTVPSGAAFFTVQTIISQIEAYLLCEPPSTLIHNTSLAQELSVTTSLDSVCIIEYVLKS